MPLPVAINNELTGYLSNYFVNKKLGDLDSEQKRLLVDELNKKIMALNTETPDDACLDLILDELSVEGDKAQTEFTLPGQAYKYVSNFTEAVYRVIHRIRSAVSQEVLAQRTVKEKNELARLRSQYLTVRQNSETSAEKLYQEILKQIKKLACLGDLKPLLELDSDEIKKLYPYFAYAELIDIPDHKGIRINKFIPIVLQPMFPLYHAQKNNKASQASEIKSTVTEQPLLLSETALSPIPSMKIATLSTPVEPAKLSDDLLKAIKKSFLAYRNLKRNDSKNIWFGEFINKALNYVNISDDSVKLASINAIEREIEEKFKLQKATHLDWLNYLLELAIKADNAQMPTAILSNKNCSDFTEVIYVVIHTIREAISKTNPCALGALIAKKHGELAELRVKYLSAKNRYQGNSEINDKKQELDNVIKQLACLGDLDPLLELSPHHSQSLYPGNTEKGFAYADKSKAFGCEGLNIYTPLILQKQFRQAHTKKHEKFLASLEHKEKTVSEERTVSEANALMPRLTALENNALVGLGKQQADVPADTDEQTIEAVERELEQIETTYKALLASSSELSARLKPLAVAIVHVRTTFDANQSALEIQRQQKAEAEHQAEEKLQRLATEQTTQENKQSSNTMSKLPTSNTMSKLPTSNTTINMLLEASSATSSSPSVVIPAESMSKQTKTNTASAIVVPINTRLASLSAIATKGNKKKSSKKKKKPAAILVPEQPSSSITLGMSMGAID